MIEQMRRGVNDVSENLHPSVREFKEFINRYPKLRQVIRKNERPLQDYYEKWALLGEDDPMWDQYKGKVNDHTDKEHDGKHSELFKQVISMAKNMDMNKVQKHINEVSVAVHTIQNILGHVQQTNQHPRERPDHLFHIFRD